MEKTTLYGNMQNVAEIGEKQTLYGNVRKSDMVSQFDLNCIEMYFFVVKSCLLS